MSKRIVETILPQEFFLDLGIYLQTCAHIEFMACTLICRIEGHLTGTAAYQQRFNQLRKTQTTQLIAALRKSNPFNVEPDQSDFLEFVAWIDCYKANRHMAAHGAFFWHQGENTLRVNFTHNQGTSKNPIYVAEKSPISREVVQEVMGDADRILGILFGLLRIAEDQGSVAIPTIARKEEES